MKSKLCFFSYLLKNQFSTPLNWILTGGFWLFNGYLFSLMLEQTRQAALFTSLWWAAFLSLFMIPLQTMDLFSKNHAYNFFYCYALLNFPLFPMSVTFYTKSSMDSFTRSCFSGPVAFYLPLWQPR